MNHTFEYAPNQSFYYIVKRQRRKTMALHIMPDASVEVRVPKWVPKREWLKFVSQRAQWIVAQQQQMLQKLSQQPGYAQGEKHHYLGRAYPLALTVNTKTLVSLEGAVLAIGLRRPDNSDSVKRALQQWYRSEAQRIFAQRINHCYALFPHWFQQRYAVPELTVRNMRRRWGSCSLSGAVTLNVQLIKMPLPCVDYVVMHELCHLAEFNHSSRFYRLLAQVMPDWQAKEQLLESRAL